VYIILFVHVSSLTELNAHPGLYESLLQQTSPHEDVIGRDLTRTFPNHILFRMGEDITGQTGSQGRNALFNVCKAYSIHDPQVGYCQGMGFLVGK
jgi:hypothetical protein